MSIRGLDPQSISVPEPFPTADTHNHKTLHALPRTLDPSILSPKTIIQTGTLARRCIVKMFPNKTMTEDPLRPFQKNPSLQMATSLFPGQPVGMRPRLLDPDAKVCKGFDLGVGGGWPVPPGLKTLHWLRRNVQILGRRLRAQILLGSWAGAHEFSATACLLFLLSTWSRDMRHGRSGGWYSREGDCEPLCNAGKNQSREQLCISAAVYSRRLPSSASTDIVHLGDMDQISSSSLAVRNGNQQTSTNTRRP